MFALNKEEMKKNVLLILLNALSIVSYCQKEKSISILANYIMPTSVQTPSNTESLGISTKPVGLYNSKGFNIDASFDMELTKGFGVIAKYSYESISINTDGFIMASQRASATNINSHKLLIGVTGIIHAGEKSQVGIYALAGESFSSPHTLTISNTGGSVTKREFSYNSFSAVQFRGGVKFTYKLSSSAGLAINTAYTITHPNVTYSTVISGAGGSDINPPVTTSYSISNINAGIGVTYFIR